MTQNVVGDMENRRVDATAPVSSDDKPLAVTTVPNTGVESTLKDFGSLKDISSEFFLELRELLSELDYDRMNQGVRGDYHCSPLPATSYETMSTALEIIPSDKMNARQKLAIEFFLMGEPLSSEDFQLVLGARTEAFENEALAHGLLLKEDDSYALNNVGLISKELPCGKTLFCFADLPPYFERNSMRQRVYSGTDSYILNARLMEHDSLSGVVLEGGSGSGLQVQSLLLTHEEIEAAYGIEIDVRARNLSLFNARLNGVEDKYDVVASFEELSQSLDGQKIRLAFSNPPFIATADSVIVQPHELSLVPEDALDDSFVQMKELFCTAGWGGPDGLAVTREFVEGFAEHLDADGEILIFSQFAIGQGDGLPLGMRLLPDQERACTFEKLCAPGDFLSPIDWGVYVRHALEVEHPSLRGSQLALTAGARTIIALQLEGAVGMNSGFLRFQLGSQEENMVVGIRSPEELRSENFTSFTKPPFVSL